VKLQVIVLPRAECDQAEIFEYLARQSLAVAQRFVERVKDTLAGLSTHSLPGMPLVSANARLAELRWAKVRDFPNHLIFFRVSGDLIEVARVLHGARDIESILGG
jgi:toxin ParE1/3/4